jgi:hypothetical protein
MTDSGQPGYPGPPETFSVSVLTVFREPGDAPWDTGRWEVAGVVGGAPPAPAAGGPIPPRDDTAGQQLLWPGLRLALFRDEAAGYYHNLMGSQPRVFVVCRQNDDGRMEPALVTLNYDEAGAYMEVEEDVFSVPMPAEIYRWVENFVLQHYVPERRKKRKREDWKKPVQVDRGRSRR